MAQSDAKFQSQTKPWIVGDQCRQNCMQISPGLQLCVRNWPHQKGKEKAGIKKRKGWKRRKPFTWKEASWRTWGRTLGRSGVGNRSTTISRWKALSLGSDCKMWHMHLAAWQAWRLPHAIARTSFLSSQTGVSVFEPVKWNAWHRSHVLSTRRNSERPKWSLQLVQGLQYMAKVLSTNMSP